MTINTKCPHFGTSCCADCPLTSIPDIFQEAQLLFPNVTLETGSPIHFRTRAKLAVRQEGIGLFKKGTHTVVETPNCLAHHPKINEAVSLLKNLLLKSPFKPYSESTHTGDLRYIQCVVERKSQTVQLSLVIANKARLSEWIEWCKTSLQLSLFHSVFVNVQKEQTNTIFSEEWHQVFGPECIWETIAGVEIPFGPSHFGQGNLEMFERLLLDLRAEVREDNILETYAGVGVIGLSLVSKCASITLSEREKSAERYFKMAQAKLPAALQSNISFITASSEESIALLEKADGVIVDPPRKGLPESFIKAFIAASSKRLYYISCHFPSLARDTDILLKAGFQVVFARSYLFFPGTNHIETLIIFERV